MSALQATEKKSYMTVADMLEKSRDSIASALPRHVSADRLARVALSELRTNPVLLRCTPQSLMNCIVKAGQLGFELGGALGHAYLVPYKSEATLIVGYRGLIALARRSGEIQSLTARVVHENDEFEIEFGLDEKLRHVPSIGEPGQMTHVYAVAKLTGGGIQYEVMTKREVDDIRKRSRAGSSGPWVTDYEEMARKTVVRRLFKYLPVSIEMADAMEADGDRDRVEINITPADTLNESLAAAAKQSPDDAPPDLELTPPDAVAEILAGISKAPVDDLDVWLDEAREQGLNLLDFARVKEAIEARQT
jgi:recombination protein RecT